MTELLVTWSARLSLVLAIVVWTTLQYRMVKNIKKWNTRTRDVFFLHSTVPLAVMTAYGFRLFGYPYITPLSFYVLVYMLLLTWMTFKRYPQYEEDMRK